MMTFLSFAKIARCFVCLSAITLAGSFALGQGEPSDRSDQGKDAAESTLVSAAILPITGAITDVTVESLERRIEEARSKGVEIIIFEMDTPGGLVTSSIAISDLIKNLTDIRTVAWVNPEAYSGGTIVTVACDEIVMARSSRMGDVQVIMGGPAGATAASEDLQPKAYTPVLTEFRASCRLNGYDQVLCESFVLLDREVWWLENTETSEKRFVFHDEKMKLLGEQEKEDAPAKKHDTESQAGDETNAGDTVRNDTPWRLVGRYYDPLLEMENDVIQPIVRDDQLLHMSAGESAAYGFSKDIVANESELRERYGIGSLVRIVPSSSEESTLSAKINAAILPITGAITDITVESLERRIEEARSKGVELIIFDMDTPGGLVTSSIAISDLIKNLTDIKTVTWVNPDAYSGGTIVAVACDEIVMARSSRIGDSQVIMGGPGGATAVPEDLQPKAYTPVLAEFRASCRLNGYDQVLCEAFVLPDRQVWWLENTETGEKRFAFNDEKIELLGEQEKKDAPSKKKDADADADDDATAEDTAETKTVTSWRLVEKYYDSLLEADYDVSQPIVRDDQLLQMSAGEAEAYGFSKAIVVDEKELRERYGIGSMVRIEPTWSEDLAFWMTSIYVRGFLMVIIMLGAYVEFNTPGVGVPGVVALICLGIFVGAPYLTGLANVWELLLMVVGVILIMLELFVIPGFGFPGIAGLLLVFVAILATFVPDEPGQAFPIYLPELPATVAALKTAFLTLMASLVASVTGMVMLSKYLPRLAAFSKIAPANPTPSEVQTEDSYHGLARVGDVGDVVSTLRPSGKARFAGTLVDVVTQGDYIEPPSRVEVVERRGNRVVVRAIA